MIKHYTKRFLQRVSLLRPDTHKMNSKQKQPFILHGPAGIKQVGHRRYVGGLWQEIGMLQFRFLVDEGMEPHHYLLDIACGSLRAGVHIIPYLETGHYLGIEKEEELIRLGIEKEIGTRLYELKKPQFVVSSDFEFHKFNAHPDFALAQSLFTHLPSPIIQTCFAKLRESIHQNGSFYASFTETETEVENPMEPHDHGRFAYTREQMEKFGDNSGWKAEYIGDWNHPRGHVMVKYSPI